MASNNSYWPLHWMGEQVNSDPWFSGGLTINDNKDTSAFDAYLTPYSAYVTGSPFETSSSSALSPTPISPSPYAESNTTPSSSSTAISRSKENICPYPNCSSTGKFRRRTDLQRHIRTQHEAEKNRVDCPHAWCGRTGLNGFARRDYLRIHLREVHREIIPYRSRRGPGLRSAHGETAGQPKSMPSAKNDDVLGAGSSYHKEPDRQDTNKTNLNNSSRIAEPVLRERSVRNNLFGTEQHIDEHERLLNDEDPSDKQQPSDHEQQSSILVYLEIIIEYIANELSPVINLDRIELDITRIVMKAMELGVLKSKYQDEHIASKPFWSLLDQYQRAVAEEVKQKLMKLHSISSSQVQSNEPDMSVDEKLQFWNSTIEESGNVGGLEAQLANVHLSKSGNNQDINIMMPGSLEDTFKDTVFIWLLGHIKREFSCYYPITNTMNAIKTTVLSCEIEDSVLEAHTEPLASSKPLQIGIVMVWDLMGFINEQAAGLAARGGSTEELIDINTLGEAITLSGTVIDAQALTCLEYLNLIWPDRGSFVLRLVQTAAGSQETMHHDKICALADCVELEFSFKGSDFQAKLTGEAHSVSDVVQILAWLSSTFRSTDISSGVVTCIASLNRTYIGRSFGAGSRFLKTYQISHQLGQSTKQQVGQCWHGMLRNPIVVLGYPIRYRVDLNTGLEISLPIVACLTRSTKVVVVNGRGFLKGFSSALIPSNQKSDVVIWHYVFNSEGHYLPIDTSMWSSAVAIELNEIGRLRHVVGWCSEVKVNVGAPGASTKLRPSNLHKTSSSIAFKTLSLSAGQYVTLGASIAAGAKDLPLHVSPAGYGIMEKLLWMEDKFFVLWDSKHNRGWLVDGVSTLLHMLRLSIDAIRRSRFFSSALPLKPFHEPDSKYPQAAFDFFMDKEQSNLQLVLFLRKIEIVSEKMINETTSYTKTKTTPVLLQDRVEYLWELLAQIITQQMELAKREGIYLKPYFRDTLEGWNFFNLACHHSPFEPVKMEMDCFSEPWIHFIRSINAVVLFGEDFGELIEPVEDRELCSEWRTLPKDKKYLATTVSTLKDIQTRYGTDSSSFTEIGKGFALQNTTGSIITCRCIESSESHHEDIVQVIWPTSLLSETKSVNTDKDLLDLHQSAALVFGKNERYSWWQDMAGKFWKGHLSGKRGAKRKAAASRKRRSSSEVASARAESLAAPNSSSSTPVTNFSQTSTDPTEITQSTPSESSKRAKFASILPDIPLRPR